MFSVYRPIRRSITLTEPSAEAESRIADRLKFESLFKWQITYLPKYFKYFDSFAAPERPPLPFTEIAAGPFRQKCSSYYEAPRPSQKG